MASTTLVLSDLTADVDQFSDAFEVYLQTKPVWSGNLTTQSSQTLIELVSSVGAFAQGRIIREYEDSFAETAQSDSAILSITQMQGLRIARYLPSVVPCTLTSTVTIALPPLTQFQGGGAYFFNQEQIQLIANTPLSVNLAQGKIFSYSMQGLGTERQTFISAQDGFIISDRDVQVRVNNIIIPKSFGGLWNFDGLPGYADLTMSDGRLLLQFGNFGGLSSVGQFGTIPQVNDTVLVSFPVTQGADGNSLITLGSSVTVVGLNQVTGTFTGNPQGGANDKPVLTYKNVASGGFGTYSSGVTKSQYVSIIATYPGIIDAVTQAQREINPAAVQWMNTIRVSALTSNPWTQSEKQAFLDYAQSVTMYAPYFIWVDPIAISRNVDIGVYVFNSAIPSQVKANVESAIRSLFAPRPGILRTNFYESDLERACFRSSPGLISYVIVNQPVSPMIVTAPQSPIPTYTLLPDGGTLPPSVYAYGISTKLSNGQVGTPSNWVFPQITSVANNFGVKLDWPPVSDADTYYVWGRNASAGIGLLATIPATDPRTFTDDGSITPTGNPPNAVADVPIQYNSLGTLNIQVFFAERQQRLVDDDPTRLAG